MAVFLKPKLEYGVFYIGKTTKGMVILHSDAFETEKRHYALLCNQQWEKRIGWYGRLPIPIFFDSTDWAGPFDSEREASECLSDLHDGDPIEDGIE
jgi:hypothetical protein